MKSRRNCTAEHTTIQIKGKIVPTLTANTDREENAGELH